jgi:hypothetical protein
VLYRGENLVGTQYLDVALLVCSSISLYAQNYVFMFLTIGRLFLLN